jgi:hypothetical protein
MATASDFKVQAEKLEGPDNWPCGNTPHTQYPLYLTTALPVSLCLCLQYLLRVPNQASLFIIAPLSSLSTHYTAPYTELNNLL